ncbi:MAG: hypothetical protein ACTSW1_03015 [Candidatus Hodarchaeales archaeon]
MTKCEICGGEAEVESGLGSLCLDCMMQIAQDRNYPLLFKLHKYQNKWRVKPRKIAFLFFGHHDYVANEDGYLFVPVTFAKQYLTKFGKNDQIIVVLLTDSYEEYCHDTKKHKGLHSQLRKVCKKPKIDYYHVNFLSYKLNSNESIIRYFHKILSDFTELVGSKDHVTLLFTEGMPFGMDFIQLWDKGLYDTKEAVFDMLVYGEIDKDQAVFMELRLNESSRSSIAAKPENDINSSFVSSFHNYLQQYLHIEPRQDE